MGSAESNLDTEFTETVRMENAFHLPLSWHFLRAFLIMWSCWTEPGALPWVTLTNVFMTQLMVRWVFWCVSQVHPFRPSLCSQNSQCFIHRWLGGACLGDPSDCGCRCGGRARRLHAYLCACGWRAELNLGCYSSGTIHFVF